LEMYAIWNSSYYAWLVSASQTRFSLLMIEPYVHTYMYKPEGSVFVPKPKHTSD